ncbi:hypothetical protein [Tenuibacillus multivorans]|uniref:Uncharacterized protein n=1 Tax=Tenuibacillus multivorans TaxID=237069 RepID=A0A1H0AT41_9BACI|nr:hypothetical protein [Tenuibacillus multivorans]GEL77831.1 hypothetical protein TMU01_20660 [Tenuibacillus multivorans]SDN36627.1 hypothetical protein SAMN05216498_2064 [Tenuibacillus multivorans]
MYKKELEAQILKRIPEHERETYRTMRKLNRINKQLLWQLIRDSNKENVTIYKGKKTDLEVLLNKRLISINKAYKSKGQEMSLFVLVRAPYLIRVLKREF